MNRPFRILVLANETVAGRELREKILQIVQGRVADVHVLAPALSSRFRYFMSDVDGPRARARERLEQSLEMLDRAGVDATGSVGDANPVRAFEDVLVMFVPDHVVISTHPPGRSNWLEKGVVEQVSRLTDAPVEHVVVDLDAVVAAEQRAMA